jgi:hypothetical protein
MSDQRSDSRPVICNANEDILASVIKLALGHKQDPNFADFPIITFVICYGDEVLLVHRGPKMGNPNTWSLIEGSLLVAEPIEAIFEFLRCKIGINPQDVATLSIARRRLRLDPQARKDDGTYTCRWHEFRIFVTLRSKVIPHTNWKDREAWWMPIATLGDLPLLPITRRTLFAWLRKLGSPLV